MVLFVSSARSAASGMSELTDLQQAPYLHWETMANWLKECKSIENAKSLASTSLRRPYVRVHDSVQDNFHAELCGHLEPNHWLRRVMLNAAWASAT